jgi:Tfp pilus assembly protein PilX
MQGRLLRHEDGFALAFALLAIVVLSIATTSIVTYTTSNQHSANAAGANLTAAGYAESGLNAAYSKIVAANSPTSTLGPTALNLLGCSTGGTGGTSDCSSPTYQCVSFGGTCPSPYTPTAGTAAVYGYYNGSTSPQTFQNVSVPKSTWLLVSTGYARSEAGSGGIGGKTTLGEVTITPLSAGAVASVWNHIFLTAPLDPNSCQANFSGNNLALTVPLYVIGNLCLSGANDYIKEASGGQAIDLQVGGKLELTGSNSVGDYSTSPATPITSGVVVGGCNAGPVTATANPCDNGSYKYKVTTKDTFISQDDPELSDNQVATNYSTFDPGPKHTCTAGTTPSPLADSAFDSNVATNEGSLSPLTLPDNSGSVTSGTAFELTPNSSYACISKSGTSVGYLIWNNSTSSITVSGITVAGKTLAINGSIFFDSNLTISQTMTYSGTGVIMVAGTVKFMTNNMTVCAAGTSCLFSSWQGTSGNNSMLTLASLAGRRTGGVTTCTSTTTAVTFVGNSQTYQGSLWAPTCSTLSFTGNSATVEGPISIGSLDSTVNNATFKPLPVIKNMPVGAPVPPNTSAQIGPLTIVG